MADAVRDEWVDIDEWEDIPAVGPIAVDQPQDPNYMGETAYKPKDVTKEKEYTGTFSQKMWGASMRGWMSLGSAVLDAPKHFIGQVKTLSMTGLASEALKTEDPARRKALLKRMHELETTYNGITDDLGQAGKLHRQGQAAIERNHPEWESEPPKSFIDLLQSPDKLAIALAESAPVLIGAGVTAAAGAPSVGAMMMYTVEGQEAYDQAIAMGATEEEAETAYVIYGTVSAALENMQLKGIMKIGKGSYTRVLNRTAQKVAKQGTKSLKREIIEAAAKEAAEEMAQGAWGEATAKLVYDESISPTIGAFIDARLQEGLIGGTMGLVPGLGGAVAGRAARTDAGQAVAAEESVPEVKESQPPAPEQQINVYKTVSGSRTGITEQEVVRDGDRYVDSVTGEDIILDTEASGSGVAAKETTLEPPEKEIDTREGEKAPEFPTARQKAMDQLMSEGVSMEDAEIMTSERGKGDTGARPTEVITESKEMRDTLTSIEKATTIDENNPAPVDTKEKLDEPEFTKPGLLSIFTSKRILMQRIGADKLTKKLLTAKERMLVLQKSLNKEVNKVIRSLSKQATLGDKIASRIMKRQTKPVKRMVELLDTYERLPENMTKELSDVEVEAFNKLRDMSKWLLERTNVARRQAGLDEINDLKAYIPHWTGAVADDIMNGTYPFKSGYLARLMGNVPKTIKNRTAYRRKLMQKIQDHMEQDLGRLMKGLIKYDLTDMLITNPLAQVWEELRQLQTDGLIPDTTADAIQKYINYDILDKQSVLDRMFNDSLAVRTTTDLINKVLRPMNREISNPAAYYFGGMRKLMHAAFMPFRLRPVTRNLGQRLLNLTFFRGRDLLRAQFGKQDMIIHPETGKEVKVLDYVKEQDWYRLSKPEDILDDKTIISRLTGIGMVPFKLAHVGNRFLSNVEVSALTAYYDWKYRYNESHNENSKYYKQIVEHSKKTGIPIEQLQTQQEDMMNDIRDGVQMTQWEYMAHNMPTIFRGQTARGVAAYQSWWMNYFASHGAEAMNRIYTGRTRVRGDGTGGRLLTRGARIRSVKGMGAIYGMARLAQQTLGIAMLGALFLPDPTDGLPPVFNLFSIMSRLVLGYNKPEQKRQAWKDLKKFGARLLPFNNAIRDAAKVGNDWTVKDYVFYTDNEEWKQIWVPTKPAQATPKRGATRSVPRRRPVRRSN